MYSNNIGSVPLHEPNVLAHVEKLMLNTFSPELKSLTRYEESNFEEVNSLWHYDAVHRARNLAQLATSLGMVAGHPSRRWLPEDLICATRFLARAYNALGTETDESVPVPCKPLLVDVVVHLTMIFGSARQITALVNVDALALPPGMRRALVLFCSELVINALKYGYPGDTGGIIYVCLTSAPDRITLIVDDDGIGCTPGVAPGLGSTLMKQFGTLLGASVSSGLGCEGRGYRVEAVMPRN